MPYRFVTILVHKNYITLQLRYDTLPLLTHTMHTFAYQIRFKKPGTHQPVVGAPGLKSILGLNFSDTTT